MREQIPRVDFHVKVLEANAIIHQGTSHRPYKPTARKVVFQVPGLDASKPVRSIHLSVNLLPLSPSTGLWGALESTPADTR